MNQWAMRNPERAAEGEDYLTAHSDLADMRDDSVEAELDKRSRPRRKDGATYDDDPYDRQRDQRERIDRDRDYYEERNR